MQKPQTTDYLLFLQNAWSPYYAGGTWPRSTWVAALERSRSGQRLSLMIADFDLCENTTPIVGATASSIVPPDFDHIRQVLAERNPRLVITCGKQAENALTQVWQGSMLILPHPTYRVVTNALFIRAGKLISKIGPGERVKLIQERTRCREVRYAIGATAKRLAS